MELLIDTNVLLDIVFQRANSEACKGVFLKAKKENTKTYITASSVTDLFYIIHKETHDAATTYSAMKNIFQLVSVLNVTEHDVKEAMRLEWKDFEDCLQYVVAKNNYLDCIITNNTTDFKDTALQVMSPSEYLKDLSGDTDTEN